MGRVYQVVLLLSILFGLAFGETLKYSVTLKSSEGGSILAEPDKTWYSYGDSVTLKAVPDACYTFDHWEGDCFGSDPTCSLVVTGDMLVYAFFSIKYYRLRVEIEPKKIYGYVALKPSKGRYPCGEEVELTAIPSVGYRFLRWEGDAEGSDKKIVVKMDSDKIIKAIFAPKEEGEEEEEEQPESPLSVTPKVVEMVEGETVELKVQGGSGSYTWSADSGTFNSTEGEAVKYHAPETPGNYTITVRDEEGNEESIEIHVYQTLELNPHIVDAEPGEKVTLEIIGGKKPYTAVAQRGKAYIENSTLTFEAPEKPGKITVTVRDDINQEAKAVILVSSKNPLTCSPEKAVVDPLEEVTFTASGGEGGYTWKAEAGDLLKTKGDTVTYIAPDVSCPGSEPCYKLTVTDEDGNTATCMVLVVSSLNITPELIKIAYGSKDPVILKAVGGVPPYRWRTSQGRLEENGEEARFYPDKIGRAEVTLEDSRGSTAKAVVEVVDLPRITPSSVVLEKGEVVVLSVTGGTPPYSWWAEAGDLSNPEGSSTSYIAPKRSGVYKIKVTDSMGEEGEAEIKVIGNLKVSPAKTVVEIGEAVKLVAYGGVEPYTWSDGSEGRIWKGSFDREGRYEVTVEDKAGDIAISIIEVIKGDISITPGSTHVKPGEVVNFSVSGGTPPYTWSAEAGSLTTLEGTIVSYVAPDEPGSYTVMVEDGRGEKGKAEVIVSAKIHGKGSIGSSISIDGIPRKDRVIYADGKSSVDISFYINLPEGGKYDIYAAAVVGKSIILRVNDPEKPFVVYNGGPIPIYDTVDGGREVSIDFYSGPLNGFKGRIMFYIGYAPHGKDPSTSLVFTSDPYVLEVE